MYVSLEDVVSDPWTRSLVDAVVLDPASGSLDVVVSSEPRPRRVDPKPPIEEGRVSRPPSSRVGVSGHSIMAWMVLSLNFVVLTLTDILGLGVDVFCSSALEFS